MIGTQRTGRIDDIFVTAAATKGLSVIARGKPARLAIIDDDGNVIAAGAQVADEVEAVAINAYRELLRGKGHLQVMSKPIDATK